MSDSSARIDASPTWKGSAVTGCSSRSIDRDDVVLVVIDIQERLAAAMERREEVVAVTARLAKVASLIGAPVIVTRQYPKGLGGIVPELAEALARAVVADKTSFCCGGEPSFVEALRATGRRQVAMVGMESHICVVQTALALLESGYRVHVVEDGTCSRAVRNHDSAMARLRAEGVVVTTSESVMYEAVGQAGTEEFKALLGIVKEG